MKRKKFFDEHPLIKLIIFAMILAFGFNIIFFKLFGFASLVYEIELIILRSLRFNIPAWICGIGFILSTFFGIYFIPRFEVPSKDLKKTYLYSYTEGNSKIFVTWNRDEYEFPMEWCKKQGLLRWTIIGDANLENPYKLGKGKIRYVFETKDLEITRENTERELSEFWMEMFASLKDDVNKQIKEIYNLLLSKNKSEGGEKKT